MSKKDLENDVLTAEQKKFCEIYVTSDFFCNWVESYLEAYWLDRMKKWTYETAKTNAYKLLTQEKILKYIDKLLDLWGLNDEYVDKQLHKLISQDAEKAVKLWAIREYNLLRARLEKNRQKLLDSKQITKDVIPTINISIEWKWQWQILE